MVRNPISLLKFMALNDAALLLFAGNIVAGMTANTYFPGAAALTVALGDLKKDFETALEKAKTGNKTDIASKKVARTTLLTALREMAKYVNANGGTSWPAYRSTNFILNSEVLNPSQLPDSFTMQMKNGLNSGELIVILEKPLAAKSILVAYTTDEVVTPATVWEVVSCTDKSCTLYNLPVGKSVLVKPSLMGTRKQMITGPIVKSKPIQ